MIEIILNKNEKNWQKLDELLKTVQGRCTVRTLNLEDVKKLIEKIDKRLDHLGLPKKYRNGLVVECNPFINDFPRAYKYKAEGTNITFIHRNNNWRIIYICRNNCKGDRRKAIEFDFTSEQKEKIINSVKYMNF